MQILSAADMATVDRRTADECGIPLTALMERAGAAVATFAGAEYPQAQNIVVLAGKGNNGGDGLVAARHLAAAGRNVQVLLLGHAADLKGEAAWALSQLRKHAPGVPLHQLNQSADAEAAISAADLLIDAIVGNGFTPPLRGLAAELRNLVQRASAKVVAVDLPSGWDADSTAERIPDAFRADSVVTFTAPKLAHVFGNLTAGRVVVADIGSPATVIESTTGLHWAGTAKRLAEAPREVNANKGKYGHVLVLGGSYGTAGAPSMSAVAALRAGAGLVTAAVPTSIVDTVAAFAPELMLAPLQQDSDGAVALENLASGALDALLREKRITVLAVGPGLSTRGQASEFARDLVGRTSLPAVVDADALNAFADKSSLLSGAGRVLVLTPHPGEMARLLGVSVKDVEADRVASARRFATEHVLTLVLKGWRTLIAHPDGRVAVNTSGNPAMAKGGSGDILTGIVAAMLAQYAHSQSPGDVAQAVEAAVFLHGLAGDFAARAMDQHTVLATDTLKHLSDAFRYRVQDARGLTWICGVHA